MTRRSRVELEDDSAPLEAINSNMSQKKKRLKARRRKRFFLRLMMLAIVSLMVVGLIKLDQSDISRIQVLKVSGNKLLSDEEILNYAQIKKGDRLLFNLPIFKNSKLKKHEFIDKATLNVYYRKGYVNIDVEETPAVAYRNELEPRIYFANGHFIELSTETSHMIEGLPLLLGFTDEALSEKLLKALGKIDEGAYSGISEIHHIPKELDPYAMKFVMNEEYLVYISIETLPMMHSYATLINGADELNKCIDMIEYGPTEESQTAIVRQCQSN